MDDQTVRPALQRHWEASDASDFDAEHEIYHEDAVLDYPQSGERICGRAAEVGTGQRPSRILPRPSLFIGAR